MTGRAIFLDVDGVLRPIGSGLGRFELDPALVERLSRIVAATGAEVVLCSDWAEISDAGTVRESLERQGVVGLTDILRTGRGKRVAVAGWLRMHPDVGRYVVLDDRPTGMESQVHVDGTRGLTEVSVRRATEMLTGGR